MKILIFASNKKENAKAYDRTLVSAGKHAFLTFSSPSSYRVQRVAVGVRHNSKHEP